MPLIRNDLPHLQGPRIVVHPSVAVELSWALAAADMPDYHPALAAAFQTPGLRSRVLSFWPGEFAMSCGGFIEVMVLAHAGGLLFTSDAALLLSRLPELCVSSPTDLRLASEPDADSLVIRARLEHLRSSDDRRREYVQLLADMWAAVGGAWEREGRRCVQAAIAARQELLRRGGSWRDLVRADCDFDGLLPRLVDVLQPSEELAVVPAFFTHNGLLFDLPGVLVVGVGTDQSGAQSRARTELLARRLKSISDPTRLAILDSLTQSPGTVSEIANSFGLAQPTVSNHVKLLREAGLIANGPAGGNDNGSSGKSSRRDLVVQPDAVAELLDHLQSVLRPPT